MNYYILKETFNPPYDTYIVSELIDYPELQKEIDNGSPQYSVTGQEKFHYAGKELKDFMTSGTFVIVSQKFIDVLNTIDSQQKFHYYPVQLQAKNKKNRNPNYYLLGLPMVSFFDYDRSNYRGIKEEKLVVRISQMVIEQEPLKDYSMVRFPELITKIVINETLKNSLTSNDMKGIEYTPTTAFTYPIFP